MTRAQRANLILLAVLLLLGSAALLLRQPPPAPPASLTAIDGTDISRISLRLGDETGIELARREDGWWLEAPVQLPANAFELESLRSVLGATVHHRYPAAEIDLAGAGLAPPAWVLETDGGPPLAFGGIEPIEGRRYVLFEDAVHLIDDVSASSFDANYADLAARQLAAGLGELQQISLPGLHLQRTGSGWQSTPDAGSADAVQTLADHWERARAMWVVRPLASEYAETRGEIVVRGKTGSARFLILKTAPQLELIRPAVDLNYTLPASAAQELLALPPAP